MTSWKHRSFARLMYGLVASCLAFAASASALQAQDFPKYDHVFLVIMENEGYGQIVGNPYAPILNALANDYGLATNYRGVADPSEPNYVAMLGGDFFGISSDDPHWFPGLTIHAANLMSQLVEAGKTWRGYFQGMPYPGYRGCGYCYPDKCNGIPDADTVYVSKHNGIVNFANLQNPTEFANMVRFEQLADDLAAGTVPDFSYIVPDECSDIHGAPPWCVDSNIPWTVQQNWLIANGDKFLGNVVELDHVVFDVADRQRRYRNHLRRRQYGHEPDRDDRHRESRPARRSGQHALQSLLLARLPPADVRPRLPAQQLHRDADDEPLRGHWGNEHSQRATALRIPERLRRDLEAGRRRGRCRGLSER